MKNNNLSPKKIEVQGWTFRIHLPAKLADPIIPLLLLHGHLGNENVMWTFSEPIPDTTLMIAPRAPVKMSTEQFSWHEISPQWPSMERYQSLVDELMAGVKALLDREGLSVSRYDLMGFSQGGVMAYAFAILHPESVRRVAALASFIPQSWIKQCNSASLEQQEFFIAHGTEDEIIPISKARQAANWLKEKNAKVTFCEADIGHKVSVDCFNGLGKFFTNAH
jgi:phospholipase/carboxylesterase